MPAFERPSAISASTSRSRARQPVERVRARRAAHELLDERRVDDGAALS